ncbi:hypothetical protein L9F63_007769, partial [Diploptera punctata]
FDKFEKIFNKFNIKLAPKNDYSLDCLREFMKYETSFEDIPSIIRPGKEEIIFFGV